MLENLMKEVNIQHLTGQMLPEFRWRVSVLGQALGIRFTVSEIELVKQQGKFLIGVEPLSREDWLKTIGDKIAAQRDQSFTFDMLHELTRAYFGEADFDMAMTLRKDLGLTHNFWMIRFLDGSTLWITVLPNGYRLPTDTERAEIAKTLNLLTNAKEKTVRGSESIAV